MSLSVGIQVNPELIQLGLKAVIGEIDTNIKVVLISDADSLLLSTNMGDFDLLIFDISTYRKLVQNCGLSKMSLCNKPYLVCGESDTEEKSLPSGVVFCSLRWSLSQIKERVLQLIYSQKEQLGDDGSEEITSRERDIIRDIALGLSSKEIADKNFISPHTVITHRKNISRKLGIKSISGLTIYAIVNKLISIEDVKNMEL